MTAFVAKVEDNGMENEQNKTILSYKQNKGGNNNHIQIKNGEWKRAESKERKMDEVKDRERRRRKK